MAGIASAKGSSKKKFIRLKSFGTKWRDIQAFRDELFNRVGDILFHVRNNEEFLYLVLQEIEPVNKSLKSTPESIENACAKVMSYFYRRPVKVRVLSNDAKHSIDGQGQSNANRFLESILQIEHIPYQEFRYLDDFVKADLHEINELIDWYERESSIKKFNITGDVPIESEDRMKFDFYQRCIRERGEIVKFQLYGLRKRVLVKVQPLAKHLGSLIFNERYDRPYKFARHHSESYFDCRKMDRAKHRLREFYLEEVDQMVELYESDKTRFYRVYFKRIPWKRIFHDCYEHLAYLPSSKNRLPIFEELFTLFKAKKWMAFYALGLPQVEGLFSEMCLATNSSLDSRHGLTKKVLSIRPHHSDYFNNLDYYQYHIPIQRNQFAHTGYGEDFQLKSYDLLVDLAYVLTVFSELDNPLVKLQRLIKSKNAQDFTSIEQFAEYFSLINELSALQRASLNPDLQVFESNFLVPSTNLISIAQTVSKTLPTDLNSFVESVNNNFKGEGLVFDLSNTNQAKIESLAQQETTRLLLTRIFRYPNDNLDALMYAFQFMTGFVDVIKSGDKILRTEMMSLNALYCKRLKLIDWIRCKADEFER